MDVTTLAEDEIRGVLPLGAAAALEFRAPARGRLTASCQLSEAAWQALRPVLSGAENRTRISTVADVTDEANALVCRGTFTWTVRRPSSHPPRLNHGFPGQYSCGRCGLC